MRWIVLFLFFALFISPHADCLAGDFVSLKVSSPRMGNCGPCSGWRSGRGGGS
jgi:hypothetical protein